MAESKSPLFGITPLADSSSLPSIQLVQNTPQLRSVHLVPRSCRDHAATRSRRRSSLPHDMKARKAAERSWPSPSFNVAQNAASPPQLLCPAAQNSRFSPCLEESLAGRSYLTRAQERFDGRAGESPYVGFLFHCVRFVASFRPVMRYAKEVFRHYPMFRHRSATPAGVTGNGEVRSLGDNVTSILGSAVNA